MYHNDVATEYMTCFNIADEIIEPTSMEVEEVQLGLYETDDLEWQEWQPGQDEKKPVKETRPDIKKLMNLDTFQEFCSNSQGNQYGPATATQQIVKSKIKSTAESTAAKSTRGTYRSYTLLQVQELLDLVIEEGVSARQAGLAVGIVMRTAQHYVKTYRDDEEKRLPGIKKASRLRGNNRKLEPKHTDFLCRYYDNNAAAVLWEARDALISAFPEIKSFTLEVYPRNLYIYFNL
ncbi:hypothetical protein BDC45DRAFT_578762 [Circinella umbellata]|nr:hypothetical protein BDC45DRAFT_578762 [Circinella umbellata]